MYWLKMPYNIIKQLICVEPLVYFPFMNKSTKINFTHCDRSNFFLILMSYLKSTKYL